MTVSKHVFQTLPSLPFSESVDMYFTATLTPCVVFFLQSMVLSHCFLFFVSVITNLRVWFNKYYL